MTNSEIAQVRWDAYSGASLESLAMEHQKEQVLIDGIIRGVNYTIVKAGPVLGAHYIVPNGVLRERPVSPVHGYRVAAAESGVKSQYSAQVDWAPGPRPDEEGYHPRNGRRTNESIYGNTGYVNPETVRMLRWQYWAQEISDEDIPMGGDAFIFGYDQFPFEGGKSPMVAGIDPWGETPGKKIGGPLLGHHYQTPGDTLDFTKFEVGDYWGNHCIPQVFWDIGMVPSEYQGMAQRPDGLLANIHLIYRGRAPDTFIRIPGAAHLGVNPPY